MLITKRYKELKVGDEFLIEYGAYGNYTGAIVKEIHYHPDREKRPNTMVLTYTIPHYRGDEEFNDMAVDYYPVEVRVKENA